MLPNAITNLIGLYSNYSVALSLSTYSRLWAKCCMFCHRDGLLNWVINCILSYSILNLKFLHLNYKCLYKLLCCSLFMVVFKEKIYVGDLFNISLKAFCWFLLKGWIWWMYTESYLRTIAFWKPYLTALTPEQQTQDTVTAYSVYIWQILSAWSPCNEDLLWAN